MTMPEASQQTTGRRDAVFQLLREAGKPMAIAEIADRLGIHANTVRFHLETLVSNDQVERTTAEPSSAGRPPQLFRSVPGMDPMGPRHYRALAAMLIAGLAADRDPGRRGLEAGRVWGHQQASAATEATEIGEPVEAAKSVDRLMGMLDELGFAPEQTTGGGRPQIGLRHCPFLELAESHSEVVCPVHLGLMQGAMQTWESPVTVDRLESFAEPDLCLAHLTAVGES